jgi:hypothetical protein
MGSSSSIAPRSHRPLAQLTDEERSELSTAEREQVIALWLKKAENELGASTAFAEVHRCLVLLGAPHEVLLSSAQAIDDELRHAEICHWVAEQYAGQSLPPRHAPLVAKNAAFRGCSEHESALLYVALHSALNEGIACAYLKRCHDRAATRLIATATHELLTDEVKHARLFWQLVPSRSERDKQLLRDALPALLSSVYTSWVSDTELHDRCPRGHGTLMSQEIEQVSSEALASLVIPGFRAVGIDVEKAQMWRSHKSSFFRGAHP